MVSYDIRHRVTAMVTKASGGAVLQNRSYTFDAGSQITGVTEGSVSTTYTYDLAGQLLSEAKSTGYSGAYTYDANGNRTARTLNGSTETYSYDNADKLLAISGGGDARPFSLW